MEIPSGWINVCLLRRYLHLHLPPCHMRALEPRLRFCTTGQLGGPKTAGLQDELPIDLVNRPSDSCSANFPLAWLMIRNCFGRSNCTRPRGVIRNPQPRCWSK